MVLLYACAHEEQIAGKDAGKKIKIISSEMDEIVLIKKDLYWFFSLSKEELQLNDSWTDLLKLERGDDLAAFFFKHIDEINISAYHCLDGQVSCVWEDKKRTIFLNSRFFKQSKPARVTTILHEIYHLIRPANHVACKSAQLLGLECDEHFYSAYGLEYYFLSRLLRQDDAVLKESSFARKRVNIFN